MPAAASSAPAINPLVNRLMTLSFPRVAGTRRAITPHYVRSGSVDWFATHPPAARAGQAGMAGERGEGEDPYTPLPRSRSPPPPAGGGATIAKQFISPHPP